MINSESLAAVEAARWGPGFVRPLYESYCFSRIPGTVEQLLTGASDAALPPAALAGLPNQPEVVITVLLDAFGWRFFAPRAERYPFLSRFVERGVVSQLTTMFPSTTAAHVTALHTGLPPAASGVYEWYYYEPRVDAIIAPLLFSLAGERRRETLAAGGIDPAALFPTNTLYQRLAAAGVHSTVMQHRDYANSSYSQTVCAGARVLPFRTLPEAITLLTARLAAQRGPSYGVLYVDTIDTSCHAHGPESAHVEAEIDTVLTTLDRLLHPPLEQLGRPTLLLLTADHGQIAVNCSRTIMVNRLLPELEAATRIGAGGRLLVPSGSRRDLFLQLHDEQLNELCAELAHALEGRAAVYRTADLIAQGLFGGPVGPEFLARVSNLAVLPLPGETVWWDHPRFRGGYAGSHGGLSAEEAHTQLAALWYEG